MQRFFIVEEGQAYDAEYACRYRSALYEYVSGGAQGAARGYEIVDEEDPAAFLANLHGSLETEAAAVGADD